MVLPLSCPGWRSGSPQRFRGGSLFSPGPTDRPPVDGGPPAPSEQPAPDQLSVPVADDHALTTIVGELAREGISVSELSLRLPSLDEVFYSLTGTKQDADADTPATSPETQEGVLTR